MSGHLHRNTQSVKEWLAGTRKIPFWVPELIRLQNMEHQEMMRQMGMPGVMKSLGLVTETAIVYESIDFKRRLRLKESIVDTHDDEPGNVERTHSGADVKQVIHDRLTENSEIETHGKTRMAGRR